MPKTVTRAGCLFCGKTQIRVGAINSHLDAFVPEIAKAKSLQLEQDEYHHVGMIREGRYADHALWNFAPAKGQWRHPTDRVERKVLLAFGKAIVVKLTIAVRDPDSMRNLIYHELVTFY